MPAPDQRAAEIAVARAAAQAVASDAARRKGTASAVPHSHGGSQLVTAAIVTVLLLGTLALAIYAGR